MTQPPTVTVYCDGEHVVHPHDRCDVGTFEQDQVDSPRIRQAQITAGQDPQPHYWRRIDGPPANGGGGVERLTIVAADPDLHDVRVRWRLPCAVCPYDLILNRNGNFGAVNGILDTFAEHGKDAISLRLLDTLTR